MIVDELREHAGTLPEGKTGDLLREAAARIEVCLDAIELAAGAQLDSQSVLRHVRAARYALTAPRP